MRVTLLDALPEGSLASAVRSALAVSDVTVVAHRLREERFAPCQGCFECWVDHPGTCKATDAANPVMEDIIAADVVFWTTPIRFACWDPIAKVALDKSIGLLSPFFTSVEGETHHRRRYRRYPRCAVPADTPEEARAAFRLLVRRNALNLHAHEPWVGFVDPGSDAGTIRAAVEEGMAAMRRPTEETVPHVTPFAPRDAVGVPRRPDRPRRVLTIVGSAKPTGSSLSEHVAGALEARLVARGWTAERVHVQRAVKLGREGAPSLVDAAARADLLVLAAPVYVDCLPSLVLAALGHLADAALPRSTVMLPIIQCGFPEIEHTALAVEVAWRAAREAGLGWAGHLAAGGDAVWHGPLDEGKKRPQAEALDRVASALDAGEPVPPEAIERLGASHVPAAVYRTLGNVGWVATAMKEGLEPWKLGRRPFDE